jgi:hypothetical protein
LHQLGFELAQFVNEGLYVGRSCRRARFWTRQFHKSVSLTRRQKEVNREIGISSIRIVVMAEKEFAFSKAYSDGRSFLRSNVVGAIR